MTSSLFSDGDSRSVASLDVFDDPLLETDVVPLDEIEFDIPEFLQLPTLDHVLSETYDFSPFSSPKKALPRYLQRRESHSSLGSIDSLPVQSSSENVPGASLVRHVKLKGVSANILSAHRRDAGFPSAITAGNTIGIGTTHGYVLLFDSKQLLRFFLQPPEEVGGISALSFNVDSTRLLAGHDRGVVNMWDTENGKILRIMKDIIGSAVLHVKFTDDPTKAIMSNGTGSVFLMSFKRPMGVRVCDSKVIFSGSKGEVVCVEPLIISNKISNHILNSYNPYLIAMATLTKVFIISLRPKIAVIFSYLLKGNVSTLPVISWQFIKLQVNQNNQVLLEPVIVFGRDSKIVFALVDTSNVESTSVRILKTLNLCYSLTNLVWFNSKTIAVSDQMENLRLLDIQTEEIVETLDLEPVQLVYATSAFKGIMNEIGVSAALNAASSFACYYSMTMAFDQLLVLGQESLHVFVIRTWSERVNVYRKQKLYLPAISLCRQIYQGTSKALVGPLGPQKSYLVQSTEKLLLEYTSLLLASSPQQANEDGRKAYFGNSIPFIVDTCCLMKIRDILSDVYTHFERESTAKLVFLSTVQSYILGGSITKISPFILKDLVNQNIELDQISVIQDLILKLDIETIDIDQIVKLSWQHKLFDAIIYLYNRAMRNYSVPLEELTDFLRNKDPNNRELVNKILLYLACCMTGRDITYGDVPESLQKNAKIQAWKFLLFDQPNSGSYKDRFPNSKLLLLQDTREFLNVLSITFGEPEFTSAEGQRVRQRIIDMIMLLIEKCEDEFSSGQLGSVYIFLARELMKSSLNLEGEVFNQIVSYLTTTRPELSGTKMERERVITELIISGVFDLHDTDLEEKLLNACFYSVLEFIYEKRGEYHKMLRCFCQISERNKVIFRFIRSILYQLDYVTEEQKSLLINEINHNITTLIQIDPTRAANLLLVELKLPVDRVTSQLSVDHDSQIVFQFFSGVVELIAREKISFTQNINPESSDDAATSLTVDNAFSYESNQISNSVLPVEDNGKGIATWVRDVVRKYIKLAAALDVEALEKFVRKSAALVSIEDAIEICQANNFGDLVAYLHVRAGNHLKAMKVFVDHVDKLISKFLKYDVESDMACGGDAAQCQSDLTEMVFPLTFEQIERQVNMCASLLREMIVSYHVAEKEVQNAWFALLDAVVTPVKCKTEASSSAQFKDLLFALLNSMIGYISLPSIMKKVFADPAYDTGTYEDVKDLVTGMFETCRYEHTLLSITSRLLNQDIFTKFQSLTLSSIRGVRPESQQCAICLKIFSKLSSGANLLIVFSCRHAYHLNCLERNESWEETFVEVNGLPERKIVYFCLICKSRTDPNFESRRSFPPRSAASFNSDDGRTNFSFSRQKSTHSFSQVEDKVEVVLKNQRRTRRILIENDSSGSNIRLGTSTGVYGQFHHPFTANAAFNNHSSSLALSLKPVIRPNKSVFDSCD